MDFHNVVFPRAVANDKILPPSEQMTHEGVTRIALISTPRSGNTWVRSVLAHALGLEQLTLHNLRDRPVQLPKRLILQIHWYREPNIQSFLREEGFKVLVLARHPLDVLLSTLHFAQREPEVARWLEGNTGLPAGLANMTPSSSGFAKYCTSFEAESLLSVSYQWWHDAAAVTAKFEDLVEAPLRSLAQLAEVLGQPGSAPLLQRALEIDWFKQLQSTPNRHGWHGTPGLWRQLITPKLALRIYRRHHLVFETLGYRMPLNYLSRRSAERNWKHLAYIADISR